MSLETGHKLAHYEIVEPIGKGGMGEVYRAKDGKLGRDVAIKVLPDELAQDEERLRRFQREAKVLASLNHPNIASIYGLERSGDTHYLVLELVPGETLAERIARGPIPVEEALEIADKIAEALEEAHEQGIIHRDLKPANVKLTPDDKVKVLDYGLAKAFVEESGEGDASTSMSPTITRDATRVGVILGTAAYMSPEQAKGKKVDRRTDVWAFGAVVFEMLTGRRAFPGDDVSELLAAVIRAEPQWDLLPAATPASVRRLLQRCLEKDRRERLADAADARIEIRDAQRAPDEGTPASIASAGLALWQRPLGVAIIGLVALLLGILGAATFVSPRVATSPSVKRFEILLDFTYAAVSPDGETLVYESSESGASRLYQTSLDQLEAEAIPGTEGASAPFFSPDGRWVGFLEGDRLKKVALDGGDPQLLASVLGASGASWGDDGRIFVGRADQSLATVSESGGPVEPLTALDDGELSHRSPHYVPSARAVVFEATVERGAERVLAYFLDTGQQRFLAEGVDPRVLPSGHLLIARAQTIWAVAIDLESLATRGEPAPVVDGVERLLYRGLEYVVAPDGTLLFNTRGSGEGRIVWLEKDGATRVIAGREEGLYYHAPLSLSPDGRRLAVTTHPPGGDDGIVVFDLERGTSSRLVPDGDSRFPIWSPDGRRLAFASTRAGSWDLYSVRLDDAGTVEPLLIQPGDQFPTSWSPDGQSLAFISNPEVGELWVLPLGDEPTRRPGSSIRAPSISPDGRWLAYVRRPNIFIEPFPGPGRPEIVSPEGGSQPVWSKDGRRLFYTHDGALFAVTIGSGPDLELGEPERVATADFQYEPGEFPTYTVSADERIVMLEPWQETPRAVVVINWFSELERLVPTQ